MLSGRTAFGGETTTDIIAAVIHNEPPWDSLPAQTPAGIRTLLRRCLTKAPVRRLRDIADARLEVTPYPGPGRTWQVSQGGGIRPAWQRDGREIVYQNTDLLMSVAVDPASDSRFESPRELLKRPSTGYWAMTPDGRDFSWCTARIATAMTAS